MEAAFEDGTVLWYWYDAWIAVPVALVVLVAVARMVLATTWTNPTDLVLAVVAMAGTAAVGVVALDRVGIRMAIGDPDTFGYISIVGAVVALALSFWPTLRRRRAAAASAGADEGSETTLVPGATDATLLAPGPEGEDEGATAVFEAGDEATQATQLADSATILGAPPPSADAATRITTPEPATATLTVTGGSDTGKTFSLSTDSSTVGRTRTSDVQLDDMSVSGRHARIDRREGQFYIEDVGSTAGTLVNGAPVDAAKPLRSGDVIKLGDDELSVAITDGADAGTMATQLSAAPTQVSAAPTQVSAPADGTMILDAPSAAGAWLLVRKGGLAGKTFEIRDQVLIGRDADCAISITDDNAVSGKHAMVRVTRDGAYLVQDIGSRNGTTVGGEVLRGLPLKEGSTVKLGTTELTFAEVSGAPEAAASPGATMIISDAATKGVLLVKSGPAAGTSISLPDGDIVIGRDPGAGGATLNDPAVSGRHALVRRDGDAYVVYDLGSQNGTSVDGSPMPSKELKGGDAIIVGQTELQFVTGS